VAVNGGLPGRSRAQYQSKKLKSLGSVKIHLTIRCCGFGDEEAAPARILTPGFNRKLQSAE